MSSIIWRVEKKGDRRKGGVKGKNHLKRAVSASLFSHDFFYLCHGNEAQFGLRFPFLRNHQS